MWYGVADGVVCDGQEYRQQMKLCDAMMRMDMLYFLFKKKHILIGTRVCESTITV